MTVLAVLDGCPLVARVPAGCALDGCPLAARVPAGCALDGCAAPD